MKRYATMCITVLLLITAGAAAYFIAYEMVLNKATIGQNETEIVELWTPPASMTSGTNYKKSVRVVNRNSVPCYVRVFAEVSSPDIRDAVEIDYDSGNWTKSEDGFYYYREILESGEETAELIKSVTAENDIDDFELIVYEESVQAEGYNSPVEAFESIRGEVK